MNRYVLSVAAELDLDAIWDYIAQDNIDAADRWVSKLFDAFEALAWLLEWVISEKTLQPSRSSFGR